MSTETLPKPAKAKKAKAPSQWISGRDLTARWSCSLGYLTSLRKQGLIEFWSVNVGKVPFYRYSLVSVLNIEANRGNSNS